MRRLALTMIALAALQCLPGRLSGVAGVFAQVPQPFPGRTQPQAPPRPAPTTPTTPAPAPAPAQTAAAPPPATPAAAVESADGVPTEASLGFPVYPNSQFITSYDAGKGQRYYLFGSGASFPELVKYYQGVLKTKGTLVFETPATQIFEIGRFREETMAFPSGVTIKDYTWGTSGGYLNPKRDAKPERFPSIIQIVPALPGAPR